MKRSLQSLNVISQKQSFFTGTSYQVKKYLWAISRTGEVDFKVVGVRETGKYCGRQTLGDKKNYWILDALEWLKQ